SPPDRDARTQNRPDPVTRFISAEAEESEQPNPAAAEISPAEEVPTDLPPGEAAVEPNAPETQPADDAANQTDPSKPPVAVMVNDGVLVITSSDEEALDRMEEMIDSISRMVPPRSQWVVIRLRAADATEAARTLEQLFPDSSVATTATSDGSLVGGLSRGISSFSTDLMDATGLSALGTGPLTLRIIPEVRTNSLLISGPPHKIREVESWIEILDASESDLPDSLRDRVPRMIPVLYADVEEVETIVKDVYSDYLQPPFQFGRGGRDNDRDGREFLAMMMGGRGGSNGGRPQMPAVRMTVSADTRTSQLVVSANDAVFRQVEELVVSLDRAAMEANRTIRVITLSDANATIVQDAVASLMPKVSVSTTGSTTRRTRSETSNTSSNVSSSRDDDDDGPSADDIRRRMEFIQRLREQGGFGGGDRGGGDRGGGDRGRGFRGFGDRGDGDRGGDRGGDRDGDRGGDRGRDRGGDRD
ncbi:MAG: secretin N-terminal domain-containing protein, partial [Planctomycetaceae bacterium]